ncbi:MAG: hypothetical protein IKK11_01570 [Oscillospiraceae bacterium]|nr:hypothetical protein [Oscillospiraceae bacterium]
MKNKKARFWFILWGVSLTIGSLFSAVHKLISLSKNGFVFQSLPYTDFQTFLLLVFLPFCLIPMLATSCYYAIKEKNTAIKIATICLIVQHLICTIAVLIQVLGQCK